MTLDVKLQQADGVAAFVTMTETDLADSELEADIREALDSIEGVEVIDR